MILSLDLGIGRRLGHEPRRLGKISSVIWSYVLDTGGIASMTCTWYSQLNVLHVRAI